MKASDICVGDWLNIYTFPNDNPKQDDLFPAKVSAVSIFDPFKEPDDVVVELVIERTKGIASRPLDTCLPIELTEDILVKNGFKQCNDGEFLLKNQVIIEVGPTFSEVSAVYLDYDEDYNKYDRRYIEIAIINYVHQLQHLLRLCGIEKEITLTD